MKKRNNKIKASTLRRIVGIVMKRWYLLILTLVFAIAYVAASVSIPVFVGDAVDLIIEAGRVDFGGVARALVSIAVCAGTAAISQYLMSLLNNRITYTVTSDIRRNAFSKIQKLPFSYLDRAPIGDTVSRIITDTEQVGDGLLTGFTQLFTGVATIIATLIMMLVDSPWTALAVVLVTPLSLIGARLVAKNTYGFFLKQAELRGEETAYANEMIAGQKTVTAFSQKENVQKEFDAVNKKLRKASENAVFWSSLTNPMTRFVNGIVYAVVAFVGALTAIADPVRFTVGMLTRMLAYANQYTKPFNEISGVIAELQGAMAAAERIFALTDTQPEPQEKPEVLNKAEGRVTFDRVCFSYTKERKLIEDLSLDVKPGMKVAIVGPTGCGKTTLINLLMRFYDADSGTIAVDGNNIKDVTRESLRSSFGMVLQDTWIMPGTVYENISIGKPDADINEVKEAAKNAYADGFISRLPNGYDTVIDNGSMLSEGERQLICIARVMLTDPSILILDEATSSIDTRTEIKIKKCFDRMTEGKTSFMVAHRLSTVLDADLILVMKDGSVVERGTHDELIQAGGLYAELWAN